MSRTPIDIQNRLILLQEALGLTGAQIERDTGIKKNEWSQFRNFKKYKRRITIDDAYKLKDAYGVTLEWVLDNDGSRLPADLKEAIRKARKQTAA